jgi:hypothetical protein
LPSGRDFDFVPADLRDERAAREALSPLAADLVKLYQSEREDWILTMVAAGMGVCFLPEYTATFPGVVGCPVVSPAVARNVCLVSVASRRWSPPVAAFVKAVRRHPWRRRQSLPIGEKPDEGRLPPLNALYGRGHVERLSIRYPSDISLAAASSIDLPHW